MFDKETQCRLINMAMFAEAESYNGYVLSGIIIQLDELKIKYSDAMLFWNKTGSVGQRLYAEFCFHSCEQSISYKI